MNLLCVAIVRGRNGLGLASNYVTNIIGLKSMNEITLLQEVVDNDIFLIKIVGLRATMESAISFKDALLKEIESGKRKIILDFERLTFIDSSFIGAIVVAWKKMNENNGKLILIQVNEKVKINMSITRVDNSILILNNFEDARRFLSN